MAAHPWSYLDGVSFYGEACIPVSYVRQKWKDYFEIRDFIDDRSQCPQNVIIVQKPGGGRQRHS